MTPKQLVRKQVHSLADETKPAGRIKFIHFRDGKEHYFYSAVNEMTGDRLSAFDASAPIIGQTVDEVRKIFANIRKKATSIIECIGDF